MRIIPAATLPLSRWANGAGRKADILTGDGWMTGFAWLDADAPFSHFAGRDRTITLVEGPGFTLHAAGRDLVVDAPYAPARFDGGAETTCRVAGPCRVLNVMTERGRLRHDVQILDRAGLADPAGSLACVLVALDGPARIGGATLARFDAAVLDRPADLQPSPGSRVARLAIHAR